MLFDRPHQANILAFIIDLAWTDVLDRRKRKLPTHVTPALDAHWAEPVAALLDAGLVDCQNEREADSLTLFHFAMTFECVSLAREIGKRMNPSDLRACDRYGNSPGVAASRIPTARGFEAMLSAGFAPEEICAQDGFGRTPLCEAAAHDNVDGVEWLLKNGAQIELRDKDGFTPLLAAAAHGACDAAVYLLSRGANWRATRKAPKGAWLDRGGRTFFGLLDSAPHTRSKPSREQIERLELLVSLLETQRQKGGPQEADAFSAPRKKTGRL